MSNHIQDDVVQEGKLLSAQERVAFRMISTGNDLHGHRALALLAIDEGATQAQAAQRAGLTSGQVKYWLGKFRQIRLAIFPDQVLEAAGQDPIIAQLQPTEESKQAPESSQKAGKKKKSKDTKKKKAKKSKVKKGKKAAKKKDKKSKNKKVKDQDKKKGKKKKKKGSK
jgi:outer membrane biosynthesis protein TonB